MPITTDLNVSPYFDDFNANNQYYRVLFKPAVAVQARELTQVQSILQDQIEKFGNWAFKNGDIVSGCGVTDLPIVPYVFLQDFQSNGSSYNVSSLANTQCVSSTSGLSGRVLLSNQGLASSYPNTMPTAIYINYQGTGTANSVVFSNTDQLTFYKIPRTGNNVADTVAVINVYSNSSANVASTGNAHGISVSGGVIFVNGTFVEVINPTFGLVNAYGVAAGNNVVGFQGLESIVTYNQDPSLLDNALGYSNENAPGADRLKISPTLVSLDPATAANTTGFNPIANYNYNALVSKSTSAANLYSIVGNAVASRTYDEAGNYVTNPFSITTVTNTSGNGLPILTANSFYGQVNPGSGYAQGQPVGFVKANYVTMRRGVDTQTNIEQQITFNYGGYYVCDEVAGTFPCDQAQTVQLLNLPQSAVTKRNFATVAPYSNAIIGTASIKCFSYNSGTPGANNATYLIHVFNVNMSNGYNVNQVQSLYYNGATPGIADVISNGIVGAGYDDQLYSFGVNGLQKLKNASNNNNSSYVYRKQAASTMYSNGVVSITLSSSAPGGTDILPYGVSNGSILAFSDSQTFSLISTANVDSTALTGTVQIYNTSANVVGTSTTFVTSFSPGDLIKVGSTVRTVMNVANSTLMTVDAPFGSNTSGQTYYKSFLAGKLIPITGNINGYGSYITINNPTSFSINTGVTLQSTMGVEVFYNVLRTSVSPALKVFNKNRFVKINTTTNPLGPWCLGFSDVSRVTAIYGSPTATYSTSGSNITTSFTYDTGQTDDHYGLAYLYPKGGYSQTAYPYLLVQLDYFSTNNTPGIGFFTVESYPIDDANTANTNAVQTKDIPLYVDTAGNQKYLRDYVDFRIPSTSTATDTGNLTYDGNNNPTSASITTAVALASVNPSNTVSLLVPGSGLNTPAYGANFQADYTMYLPRKDLIMITPDNTIKVKEGVSRLNPQTPLYPDNAMVIAVFNIPPFPSLTNDQITSDQTINQNTKNLIRDVSTSITTNIVTNRGYTMSDIGKLDQRITNLEYYTSLSLLESQASNLTVTDQNGLNRFKNGIFVDPFNDFTYSDVTNQEYSVAIDSTKSIARPKFAREVVYLKFNSGLSSTVQKTGRVITLPYTSVSFITQPYATKYRAAAHVAFAWNGSMILLPCFDNNIDINQTAAVNITQNNATPWQQFASSPFGSVWGPWKTTQTITTNTVISGTATKLNVNLGYNESSLLPQTEAQYSAAGYQIGSISGIFVANHGGTGWGAAVSSTNTTVSNSTSHTIINNLGSTPNYSNIGAGAPIYQSTAT